ncbi:methyltransferase [Ravibacter arvi]|uniref:Methyltransferase n=1 Tax=Ravibacter arvi TaxID=2051041 RepID=A0ABP8LT81_9BACT
MKKELSALDAKYEAQKIAFGPLYFQAVMAMLELGVLELIGKHRNGISLSDLKEKSDVSEYGVEVLVEAAETIDVVRKNESGLYQITKIGFYLLKDEMTRVNLNYMKYVCYKGADFMKESITTGRPMGLKTLGNWPTLYEGLSQFPDDVKKAWFDFDHYYSDDAFPHALEIVFRENPARIFDVGGNTGKWAIACCKYSPEVKVTILDLPGQLNVARENARQNDLSDRIAFHQINLLDDAQKIPAGADAIWMSQFLDCFSKSEILQILKNAHQAAGENTFLYIMEPFFDNQRYEAAKYSLVATSLYFTIMANGNSKMYSVDLMKSLVAEAGFELAEEFSLIGDSYHTILKCKKK